MSNEKPRYKVGDKFKATVQITGIDNYDDIINSGDVDYFQLSVLDLNIPLDSEVTKEDLDEAFNPVIKRAKLKKSLEAIQHELDLLDKD